MLREDVAADPHIEELIATLRRASSATDPIEIQMAYGGYIRRIMDIEAYVGVSTRGLPKGEYKVTRRMFGSRMVGETNPWRNWASMPTHSGGFLGAVVADPYPKVFRDLHLSGDPVLGDGYAHFGSAIALPMFDGGEPLNWAVSFKKDPGGFPPDQVAEALMRSNLIGGIIRNLVNHQRVEELNRRLSSQLEEIAQIQRSLLPDRLPTIPGLNIAASYLTSNEAGGDYYDFFDLGGGRWGVIVADVSGHGAGAATVMAMLRTILHAYEDKARGPASMLEHANRQLLAARIDSNFVTAFFAVFDAGRRRLTFANAGHHCPVVHHGAGDVGMIQGPSGLPLGIVDDPGYEDGEAVLHPGQSIILYTDGITEAFSPPPAREMFGSERLVSALRGCTGEPMCVIDTIHRGLHAHTGVRTRADDQTIVAIRVDS